MKKVHSRERYMGWERKESLKNAGKALKKFKGRINAKVRR